MRSVRRHLSAAILMWLLAVTLAHAQGPNLSIQTPLSGVMGNSFQAFVSLSNGGAAAANSVMITTATLEAAALNSPGLPFAAGDLVPGGHTVLDLRFDGTTLVVGSAYQLMVQGTYQADGQTLNFTVSQLVTITVPSGPTQVELQRWVALDDVKVQFSSLPGTDRIADAQAMLAFLQGRPEFVDAGVTADSSSIWGRFADGQAIILSQDRKSSPPSGPAATASIGPEASLPPPLYSELPAVVAPLFPLTGAAPAAGPELPKSPNARILNTLGPGYGGSDLVGDITTWLNSWNYSATNGDATVDALKTVDGEGIFYITSHGGNVGRGTPDDPYIYAVWTSTVADPVNDIVYYDDLTIQPPLAHARLVRQMAWKHIDASGRSVVEQHYGFTDLFVTNYWKPFSASSFVYIDACNSGNPILSNDLRLALFNKNASVLAGWSFAVDDDFAADTARLVFDRLLGSNTFNGPARSVGTHVLEREITGFDQRSFYWQSVDTDLRKHNLGQVNVTDFLNFDANPVSSAPSFGLLAPSILLVSLFETDAVYPAGTLLLIGDFGSDPRPDSQVTVGGKDCPVEPGDVGWNPGQILCDVPSNAAGDVVVTVRKHESNKAQLTKWTGTFRYSEREDGTLRTDITVRAAFRADIRKVRPVIHESPALLPFSYSVIPDESSASYTCSGTAVYSFPGETQTFTSTGAGNLPGSRHYPPPPGFFQMGGVVQAGSTVPVTIEIGGVGDAAPGCDVTFERVFDDGRPPITISYHVPIQVPRFDIGLLATEPDDPSFPAGFRDLTGAPGCSPIAQGTATCRIEWDVIQAVFPPDSRAAR